MDPSNSLPLVSIAMPVYNGGRYLRLAVLSIVRQTYSNWELLIIDDGSTDHAMQEVEAIKDSRIRIFRDGQNKGLAARLNECIDLARGKYLARMDADDVSYPERLSRQIAYLDGNPAIDLVAVRAITIDEEDRVTGLFPKALTHDDICAKPWRGFHFPHPTWVGRVEWFRKHRYTLPAPYFCEDQELLLRSYHNSRFGTLDEILFAYRVRSNVKWQKLAKTRYAIFVAQWKHFLRLKLWRFLLLAIAMFIAKMCVDILKRAKNAIFQPPIRAVDDRIKSTWQAILQNLKREWN